MNDIYYLVPSNSHLWVNCPHSAEQRRTSSVSYNCEAPPIQTTSTTNSEAVIGIRAHKLAAAKIRRMQGLISKEKFEAVRNEIQAAEQYSFNSIDKDTDGYVNSVKQMKDKIKELEGEEPRVLVECPVSFANISQGLGKGAADCVIISERYLAVIDYKNGSGIPVNITNNPQVLIYALGILSDGENYSEAKTIKNIIICIYQDGSLKYQTTKKANIYNWLDGVLIPAIDAVYNSPDKTNSGPWCSMFCPKAKTCQEIYSPFSGIDKPLSEYTADELARLLKTLEHSKMLYEQAREEAEARITHGENIPGFIMYEGQKCKEISDEKEAIKRLTNNGYKIEDITKLKSINELTKTTGDAEQLARLLDGLIIYKQNKPHIRQDKRK